MLLFLAACGAPSEPARDNVPNWPCSCAPQPAGEPSIEERFAVRAADRTDVLVAVDPAEDEAALAALPVLVEELDEQGTDWRIGVVSTAVGEPSGVGLPVGGWLVAGDPLPESLTLPADPPLAALDAAATALALAGLRPDAAVHVAFLAGEDDATGDADAWRADLAAARPFDRERSVAVLAPVSAVVLRSLPTDDEPLGTLSELAELAPLAARVAVGLTRTFALSSRPVPDTLEVRIEDPSGATLEFERDADYAYEPDQNVVRFHEYWPVSGQDVVVTYREAPLATE